MTHSPVLRNPLGAFGPAQAIRAFPYAAFTLVIAVVAACGVGIAAMPASPVEADDVPAIHGEAPAHAAARTADLAAGTAAVHARARCAVCGVIESIKALEPVADRPQEFEFTVRLRDRSARVSHTVGRAKWHVGDRIVLMGGGPPTD
jgi:hypothetical protein